MQQVDSVQYDETAALELAEELEQPGLPLRQGLTLGRILATRSVTLRKIYGRYPEDPNEAPLAGTEDLQTQIPYLPTTDEIKSLPMNRAEARQWRKRNYPRPMRLATYSRERLRGVE